MNNTISISTDMLRVVSSTHCKPGRSKVLGTDPSVSKAANVGKT